MLLSASAVTRACVNYRVDRFPIHAAAAAPDFQRCETWRDPGVGVGVGCRVLLFTCLQGVGVGCRVLLFTCLQGVGVGCRVLLFTCLQGWVRRRRLYHQHTVRNDHGSTYERGKGGNEATEGVNKGVASNDFRPNGPVSLRVSPRWKHAP
jgi:hypothetical protein